MVPVVIGTLGMVSSGNLPIHLEKIRITTKRYNCHRRQLCLELKDCVEDFWRPKAASRSLPSEYISSKKIKLSNNYMNNNNNNNTTTTTTTTTTTNNNIATIIMKITTAT